MLTMLSPSLFVISLSGHFVEVLLLWGQPLIVLLCREEMINWRTGLLLTPWGHLVLILDSYVWALSASLTWDCQCHHGGQRNLKLNTMQAVSTGRVTAVYMTKCIGKQSV